MVLSLIAHFQYGGMKPEHFDAFFPNMTISMLQFLPSLAASKVYICFFSFLLLLVLIIFTLAAAKKYSLFFFSFHVLLRPSSSADKKNIYALFFSFLCTFASSAANFER